MGGDQGVVLADGRALAEQQGLQLGEPLGGAGIPGANAVQALVEFADQGKMLGWIGRAPRPSSSSA